MKLLICLLVVVVALVCAYKEAPRTFEAKDFTRWGKFHEASKKGSIKVDFTDDAGNADVIELTRLDLVGDAKSRGIAHGALLAKEIVEFVDVKLTKFYADEVLNLDISAIPEPLHSILRVLQIKGAIAAPKLFNAAMEWVWEKEAKYVPQNLIDEMDGMGEGMCSTLSKTGMACNSTEWAYKIKSVNMLPELIRMACTAYGAWGKATPNGGLLQVRALDFGSGPFANYTIISTSRGDSNNPDHAFVSVSFPGFVGVITGVSQNGIGISEKVWMTYDKRSLQPGSYDGLADIFVLRNILENSKTKAEAETYMANVARTWAMWVGVGDFASNTFDLVGYKQESALVYTDVTMPSMTGQPFIENIAYVDKHPQPTGEGPTGTLPTALLDFYGNVTSETSKVITQFHETGDLHIASYDFSNNVMYVSIGRINKDGNYHPDGSADGSVWKAYNRPYLKFNLKSLFAGVI